MDHDLGFLNILIKFGPMLKIVLIELSKWVRHIPANPVRCVWGEEWNIWMERIGLVHLNLGTKKALVLLRNSEHNNDTSQVLLYEINLIFVLRCIGCS
jgi:hypothetical protein